MPTPKVNRVVVLRSPVAGGAAVFRSAQTHDGSAAPNPHAIAVPAGVQDGDVLLAFLVGSSTVQNLTGPPAGWDALADSPVSSPGSDAKAYAYRRVAASEPASYDWTYDAAAAIGAVVLAYRNGNAASPLAGDEGAGYAATLTPTGPALTPSADNCVVVAVYGGDFTGSPTWTPPNGYEERVDFVTGGTNVGIHVADKTQTAAAAETPQATCSISDEGCAFTVAIRPA